MGTTLLKLGGDWEEVKAKIKEKNIDLTDEDLVYKEGQEDELIERLSKKLKRSKEDTKAYIESVSDNRGVAG
ncbi:MAG: general stress protein CsbD [Flavitalea sp.]